MRVVFISGGPKYSFVGLEARLAVMSGALSGICLTSFMDARTLQLASFEVQTVAWGRGGVGQTLRMLRKAIEVGRAERRRQESARLVICTDALKSGLVGLVISWLARSRLVIEVNGEYARRENYADLGRLKGWLTWSLYSRLARFVMARSDGVRLLYPEQAHDILPRAPGIVVEAIPELVYTDMFTNLGDEKIIFFAGFPFFLKGVDLLINAFKSVTDRHPDWTLEIMGWFPDTDLIARHVGGHPRIIVRAPVAHEEMPTFIGRCGVLVLPSRSEGMGRVLVEAMAAGKARIGARTGGIPSVIADEHDGLLFDAGSERHLAEQLDRVMSDEVLRRRLGRCAQERALREFTPDCYLARTIGFYRRVAAAAGSQPS